MAVMVILMQGLASEAQPTSKKLLERPSLAKPKAQFISIQHTKNITTCRAKENRGPQAPRSEDLVPARCLGRCSDWAAAARRPHRVEPSHILRKRIREMVSNDSNGRPVVASCFLKEFEGNAPKAR